MHKIDNFNEKNKLGGITTLTTLTPLEQKRKDLLDFYRKKQSFRAARGKSRWVNYEKFDIDYDMREILDDEIVIEFDIDDKELTLIATHQTGINLYKEGITFEIWDHGGKSPHLHIHNLPIASLEKDKRKKFKDFFAKKFVPKEYHNVLDTSLFGIHLIAVEWQYHWKGKYGIKELIGRYVPKKHFPEMKIKVFTWVWNGYKSFTRHYYNPSEMFCDKHPEKEAIFLYGENELLCRECTDLLCEKGQEAGK